MQYLSSQPYFSQIAFVLPLGSRIHGLEKQKSIRFKEEQQQSQIMFA